MKKQKEYQYDLIQDGIIVASVICSSREAALKEITHYATIYSQDGAVEIKEKKKK